ncbi:MAG: ABC transporter substrate-binding protein, partial [Actinomycetota bacterium]|nr:ABC transporter substrate-binding protein [Actinomycetota bacterium]
MIAVVIALALVCGACGARFKDHEESGASVGTPTPSGPAATVTRTTIGSGETGPGPAPGVTDTQITIGYLLPITGAAPIPVQFDRGVNAYWSYINARNGIGGRKVKVVIEDTQSQAEVGKDKAKKLIEDDHVFAVVVLDRLENQQAIGEYLNSRRVPNIEIQTPANLAQDQVWSFGVTIDHAVQGALVADYFVKVLHAQKVGIVSENTPTLDPGRNAFTEEIKALHADLAYAKTVEGQANDFSNEALALSNSGATAVWLYMAPTTAATLANQADASGFHPTWFANSISWGFDLVLKVAPGGLAGARAFSPWLPLADPRTDTYQREYRSQYSEAPDDLGLVGWGVGQIVGKGLDGAGKDLGQNGFRNAMQHLQFAPDLWAPVSFRPGVREGANVVAVLKQDGDH